MDMPETLPDAALSAVGFLPADGVPEASHSPVFRYPYGDAVRALASAPASPDGLRRVRYANPLTGGNALPLLDCGMVQIDANVQSLPQRTNANLLVAVVEGEGASVIGDQVIRWSARDVFTVPQHHWAQHQAIGSDARLFVVSDADIYRRLNLLTEDVQAASA